MRTARRRSDCQRLAFRASRGRRFSWFSALLDGRLTGSGAVFSGSSTSPFDSISESAKKAIEAEKQKLSDDAKAAAAAAAQKLANSQGATIVPTSTLALGAAAIGALVLFGKD